MKKFLKTFLINLCTLPVFSQSVATLAYAVVDNNHRNYVNQVFGLLEPNRVSTGLLIDYGFDFTNPKIYNDSVLVNSTLMEQALYSDLIKSIFHPAIFRNNTRNKKSNNS